MSDSLEPTNATTPPQDAEPGPVPRPEPERSEFEERLGTKPQKPGLLHRIASVWKDEYDTAMNLSLIHISEPTRRH